MVESRENKMCLELKFVQFGHNKYICFYLVVTMSFGTENEYYYVLETRLFICSCTHSMKFCLKFPKK